MEVCIHSSMALQLFTGTWPLLQFRNLFTQTVGQRGRVARPLPAHKTTQTQNKAHIDVHAMSGIRTHDPRVRGREDSSCLRPCGHCDRPDVSTLAHKN
jgi:hypothetical protein